MIRTVEREAKKRHVCESCTLIIEPGDYYLEHVASPNHEDLGNTHWLRLTECGDFAERYGRALTKGATTGVSILISDGPYRAE